MLPVHLREHVSYIFSNEKLRQKKKKKKEKEYNGKEKR